ncbi:hypothetical protein B0H14DRAFT_2562072 [Mycena olivaceomarginata]|nr:hypothetical protein B0H14DRAFT_2562072 [Mycena olivaceomarginata]
MFPTPRPLVLPHSPHAGESVESAGDSGVTGMGEGAGKGAGKGELGRGGLSELGEDAGKSSRVDQVEPRKTRPRGCVRWTWSLVQPHPTTATHLGTGMRPRPGSCAVLDVDMTAKAMGRSGLKAMPDGIEERWNHVGAHECGHPDGRRTKIRWTKASSRGLVSEGRDWGTAARRRSSAAEVGLPGGDRTIRLMPLQVHPQQIGPPSVARAAAGRHSTVCGVDSVLGNGNYEVHQRSLGGPFPKSIPAPVHPERHPSAQLGHGRSTKKIATQKGVTKATQRSQPEGIAYILRLSSFESRTKLRRPADGISSENPPLRRA